MPDVLEFLADASAKKEFHGGYQHTIARMESAIHHVDLSAGAASVSVSLRRIANAAALEQFGKVRKSLLAQVPGHVSSLPTMRVLDGIKAKLMEEYLLVNFGTDVYDATSMSKKD